MMSDVPVSPSVSLRSLFTPGLQALRCHWPQFVFFQVLSLGLVLGYFHVDGIHRFCEYLAKLKQQWGLVFSGLTMIFAGVLLPEGAKFLLGSGDRVRAAEFPSTMVFFAVGGMIIDLQYRGFALLLGEGSSPSTIFTKMLIDQFVTTPIYGVPYWIVVFSWRSNGYRVWPTLSQISPNWYCTKALPLLLPAWCFWIPMTLMIYSLPVPLQFSLFALAASAWSLIMIFIAKRQVAG